ncbi:SIR2 family protein [Rhodopirellula baltica]
MSGNNPINNDQLGEFAVEAVRSAWKSNRKIIPIIGAGMSAESGVPPLDPIKHYLGGLAALVSQGDLVSSSGAPDAYSLVSSGTRNTHVGQVSNLFRKSYSENFRCFIQECGWPSRQSVEQETNRRTHLSGLKQRDRDTEATLDQLTRQIQPWLCEQLARKTSNPKINPSSVLLDWRELVQHLTEYQQDLTDALFTSIHRGRTPGAYLGSFALLVKLVGIETIFTFNFDRLIETALWNEGLSPTVFGMELGKSLPTPALSTAPCVIKMHGSTHNLLVDQQLDHPLTPDYTKRFLDLSGAYPLYVLAGLSGADRRLQDLITAASEEFGENAEMRGEPLFVWITSHRSKLPSDTFSAFSKVKAMQYVETPFPSLFFHELYLRLTDRIPNHRLGHRLKLCKPLSRLALQGDGGLPQKLLLSGSSEGLQFSDLEGCILVDSTSASVGSPDEIAAPDLPSLLRLLPDLGFRRHIIHLDLE